MSKEDLSLWEEEMEYPHTTGKDISNTTAILLLAGSIVCGLGVAVLGVIGIPIAAQGGLGAIVLGFALLGFGLYRAITQSRFSDSMTRATLPSDR